MRKLDTRFGENFNKVVIQSLTLSTAALICLSSATFSPRSLASQANLADSLATSLAANLERISAEQDEQKAQQLFATLLADDTLTDIETINILRAKGMRAFASDNLQLAIEEFNRAREIAEVIKARQQVAEINKRLGVFHYFRGEYEQAAAYYKKSLLFYSLQHYPVERANLFNNLGLVYSNMAEFKTSLDYYQQAEPIYRQYGEPLDVVDVRFNIAGLYVQMKRYDVAIESFLEVKRFREQQQDESGLALVHSDLGVAYKYAGDFQLAERYQLLAYDYYQTQGEGYHLATQCNNLAGLYNEFGMTEHARKYAEQGIDLAQQHQHKSALAGSYYELALVTYTAGQQPAALDHLQRARQLAEQYDNQRLLDEVKQLSALVYAAAGQYRQGYQSQLAVIQDKDKRNNEELNAQLAEFETKQLKQRIGQLVTQDKLTQLEFERANQMRNFFVFVLICITIIGLLLMQKRRSRKAEAELEARVSERTAELSQATDKLEEANRIKNQFLANVTHEIKTPLSVVLANAEALLNEELAGDDKPAHYRQLHTNSLYLLDIVNDLHDLSKIEADQLSLCPRQTSLSELFAQLDAMFSKQARDKGLTFRVNQNFDNDISINLDAMRFNQILINLCSNAIKFTNAGSVIIDVSLLDEQLLVRVSDTGIGMDDEQASQVFGCFVQADENIARRFGGSGLGLYLVAKLCSLMQADISVSSAIGRGSVFTLTVPITSCQHHSSRRTVSASIHSQQAYRFTGQVLVAEDHPDNRALISLYLQRLGLEVLAVENGELAINAIEQHELDLVLMDLQMPVLDGFAALTRLRKSGFQKPVYAFTANAMSHDIEHFHSIGFTGCVEKPLDRQNLISMLQQHLPYQSEVVIDETPEVVIAANQDAQAQQQLAKRFRDSIHLDVANICRADAEQDWQAMSRYCHKLSGAALMFGDKKLADVSRQLELCLVHRRFEQKHALLMALKREAGQMGDPASDDMRHEFWDSKVTSATLQ
ncbi:response regulator [Thalassotalea mangrovi]|nr:response regulator [Thalassotalea mangrovi]